MRSMTSAISRRILSDIYNLLPDALVDKSKRRGVLKQRPNLSSVKSIWCFGIDFKLKRNLTSLKGCELLDDSFDDLMHIARWSIR